jgi:ATP-dependent helicase YprA (DUF1998 family)
MKVWKLAKYCDDSIFNDTDDAEFLSGKISNGDQIDFSGVDDVTIDAMKVLLSSYSPENIDGLVTPGTDNNLVAEKLLTWLDSFNSDEIKPKKPVFKKPGAKKPVLVIAPPKFSNADQEEHNRYTPSRLHSRLKNQLRSYIESAYPLSDPILVRARNYLLENEHNKKLLAQEPYIETTQRYKTASEGYKGLGLPDKFGDLLHRISNDYSPGLLYPGMWWHQARAFESYIRDGKNTIVATGTGSGKTECFLVPLLSHLHEEADERPTSFKKPGVRALILYPMNALVNDQTSRLRLLLGNEQLAGEFRSLHKQARNPTFGMYTGRTPYPGPRKAGRDAERVKPLMEFYNGKTPGVTEEILSELKAKGRFPAKDLKGFYADNLVERYTDKNGKERNKWNWNKRLHTQPGDRELLTRQEMIHGTGSKPGHAPDVLVTNYSMLEYMLMRPFERPLFEETRQWLAEDESNEFLIVLDEAHMYRGSKGAEVAFLIRRLKARLGLVGMENKLRVICTSASLGDDEESKKIIRYFAADLTGTDPESFVTITGEKELPEPALLGGKESLVLLSNVDLETIDAVSTPDVLLGSLNPIFKHFGHSTLDPATVDEEGIFSTLYKVLDGNPLVNQLLKVTSEGAISLSDLATGLYKENTESSRKASEVLVTLGTLARPKADEPGLVPTRVHMMFRGLSGLYACINPCCSGRQDSPGKKALLGKLFTSPRQTCNGCGGRVLEIASCRGCGAPYLKAWIPSGTIAALSFLWSEVEGDVEDIYLLLTKPRHDEFCEEVRVHISTGYIDVENTYPDDQVVTMWLSLRKDNRQQIVRDNRFEKCPMCKPVSARSRSIISDFKTKGEQAFTALIDAQFAEQPPQNNDESLPNRGRKVLVFSDGRQKAARLAPALEYSHSRDLFRQLLAISVGKIREIGKIPTVMYSYPAIVWLSNSRGVDPFPLAQTIERSAFNNHREQAKQVDLKGVIDRSNMGLIKPTQSYAKSLFAEMTDKFFSLQALGLAEICEHPVMTDEILSTFPVDDLTKEESKSVFRAWIRVMLEAKNFLPPGSDVNQFGEFGNRPDGIELGNSNNIVPPAFEEYIKSIAGASSSAGEIIKWFVDFVANNSGFLDFTNNRYYLSPEKLCLSLAIDSDQYLKEVFRCQDCGTLHLDAVRNTCHQCSGQVVIAEKDYLDSRTGYYRNAVRRALKGGPNLEPFGLSTAEHSAQLTGDGTDGAPFNKTELYELRFQDMKVNQDLPIDVLSCTTTMEVGIDIGALSGVALRNVPPHVSNYQQRAGRAGRRGKAVASVLTYAHGSSHDSQMYNTPAEIISGDVLSPIVYVENKQILHRHINAYLIQRFFHEKVVAAPDLYELFQSLGTVEDFLSDKYSCSYPNLLNWLVANESILKDEIRDWAPEYSHGAQEPIDRESVIEDCVGSLKNELVSILPVQDYERREELEGLELDHLTKKIEENLLETLINQAVLPRYAFPTDLVNFWVPKERRVGDHSHRLEYDYQPSRDLQIALSEYAPGRNLTIDKFRFTAAALYSPYQDSMETILSKADSYTACDCGYVSMLDKSLLYTLCPCCGGSELFKQKVIRPPGFAPDINEKRKKDQGDGAGFGGQVTKAQIEISEPPSKWDLVLFSGRLSVHADSKELVLVNKGKDEKGFIVCQTCGRTEYIPSAGIGFTRMLKQGQPRAHKHPIEKGLTCNGHISDEFFMGYKYITDILLLKIKLSDPVVCSTGASDEFSVKAGRSALTSLVEALCLSASRVLQIDEGELSGNWTPIPGGGDQEVYLFLYDLLPGGAGYTRLVKNNLEKVFNMAQKILSSCDCEQSCYNCLRHYGNNYIHAQLDRTLALDLLIYLRTGKSPIVNVNAEKQAIKQISEVFVLKGIEYKESVNWPLQITKGTGQISVNTHHPLTRPEKGDASFSIDTYTLIHDTPAAMARIEGLL